MRREGAPDWRVAPLSPFVAVVVHWEAMGFDGGPESLSGHSWMGWIARAPADWRGVRERLARLAPEGASVRFGCSPEGSGGGEVAPVKPPGAHAPWLSSEEVVHRDLSSPRIPALMATWGIPCQIPSVWSDAWHDRMTRMALGETMVEVGSELERIGFGLVEPMGLRRDIAGEDYWVSVAAKMWPAWEARAQACDLALLLPSGGCKGQPRAL